MHLKKLLGIADRDNQADLEEQSEQYSEQSESQESVEEPARKRRKTSQDTPTREQRALMLLASNTF